MASDKHVIVQLVYLGYLEEIKKARVLAYTWNENTFHQAIIQGRQHIIEYLHENQCPWDEDVFNLALHNQNIKIIKYLFKRGYLTKLVINVYKVIGEHDMSEEDELKCIDIYKYLHANGVSFFFGRAGDLCYFADRGYFKIIKYLQHGAAGCYEKTANTCANAAVMNQMEILEFLYEENYPFDAMVFMVAAGGKNNLRILEYLHNIKCLFDTHIYNNAIMHCSMENINFLYEKGYKWDTSVIQLQLEYCSSLEIIDFFVKHGVLLTFSIVREFASRGYLKGLEYYHEKGYPWTYKVIEDIIEDNDDNNIECLQYVWEHGCPYEGSNGFCLALTRKHTNQARYIYENMVPKE